MSRIENHDNLLIDFNNLNVSDQPINIGRNDQSSNASISTENNNETKKSAAKPMALYSSQPLYKLLNSELSDIHENNNPFDHLDKQSCLLDDPFEIVENAAILSDAQTATGINKVETGTLILFDSPVNTANETKDNVRSETICDTPKTANDARNTLLSVTPSQDSVQNTSQKQSSNSKNASPKTLVSPSAKSRCKTKSTSMNLLKYSLSNSRTDLTAESVSFSEENISGDELLQKKQMIATATRRESATDDSFDDIWATKPNLIDSQNDIDIDADSDIDNDIAKLNIPMLLNVSTSNIKAEDNTSPENNEHEFNDLIETKAHSRNELREKLASIKQRIPQSPVPTDVPTIPIHNQTVDIQNSKIQENTESEPITPKSQYSSVLLPPVKSMENTNSLIEHLKKLVDQCDDKSKQTTAKHLLDDLSSILTTNNDKPLKTHVERSSPPLIKRQGTFCIEKEDSYIDENRASEINCSVDEKPSNTKASVVDSGLSQVMKQIQNVLGSHQNINVVQHVPPTESTAPVTNPTYIVVMAQPAGEFSNDEYQNTYRGRSQSLSFKEKPLTVNRAIQQKAEQLKTQSTLPSTPVNRPVLQRRSSFGAIIRAAPKNHTEQENKPSKVATKPDAPKLIRRRSLQAPTKLSEPEPIQTKPLNPVTRRRSFQSAVTTTPMYSTSSKTDLCRGPTSPLRMSSNTNLTRRKSFANDSAKDSLQKMKTSYGIMKKPPVPPMTKNLKIRVSNTVSGRSTVPLRAVVPMNRVASLLLTNETVSPVDDNRSGALITSTPRSISSISPSKTKKGPLPCTSTLPAESPIPNLNRNTSYLSMTPSKSNIPATTSKVTLRRRTLSDYRTESDNKVVVDSNTSGKAVSSIKNATKTLASGLSKFTAKRMSNIGLKVRPSSAGSKENKQP